MIEHLHLETNCLDKS